MSHVLDDMLLKYDIVNFCTGIFLLNAYHLTKHIVLFVIFNKAKMIIY